MTQRTTLILSFALFVVGLFWGGYTLLMYLGMPIHQLVYLQGPEVQYLDQTCGTDTMTSTILCRGTSVLGWFVASVFQMGSPFLSYVVLSLLGYLALLLWVGYHTGTFRMQTRIRPVLFIVFFIVSAWLIGTTLSVTTLYNAKTPENQMVLDPSGQKILPPFTRFYEPDPKVFSGIGEQAMSELQANYQDLLKRDCLRPVTNAQGQELVTSSGARVFDLSFMCMQQAMFLRVGLQIAMVLLFLLNLLVLGRFFLLKVIRIQPVHPLFFFSLSIGIGSLLLVAILWSAAVLGILTGPFTATVFFGIPIVLFPWTKQWISEAMRPSISIDIDWKNPSFLLVWLLISYLALNFLNVVRPFPIGWDDLGSYLNRPRLLASYGSFIPSMSQFQWEYLTSLGFLIFGYDSPVGSTFSMQINWAAGLLAVLVTYTFGRLMFGKRGGALSAMLYYFLPMTGHFSFADMKIDNASYFTTVLAILIVCIACFKSDESDEEAAAAAHDWRLFLVAGLIAGFSFGIKVTAILAILLCISLIAGSSFGFVGFLGSSFGSFAILAQVGVLSAQQIAERMGFEGLASATTLTILLAIAAIACFTFALHRHKQQSKIFGLNTGIFILGIALSCALWGLHNGFMKGTLSPMAMLGAPDTTAPLVFFQQESEVKTYTLAPTNPVRALTPELKLDPNHAACKTSARAEELDRYWGFNRGVAHYLQLPWRQVMNVDAYGYYVTLMPALLLFPLLLLLPFFWRKEGRWFRYLMLGTGVFLLQWMFVANGVMWYGIGMFLGFVVALEAFIARAPDRQNRWLYAVLITFSIFVCLVNRFWQFDTQKNIFEYPLGKVSASALREVTIPQYDDIRESVVTRHEGMPDRPYTYRIGTFISYFIPKNREIFPLADHQMSFFNCINQERNHELTYKRLKQLGFNSIIFDTNTQTIEKDPNGSLHKKVEAFLAFVNDPVLKLPIVVNDPGNGIAYILLP